jgi:hypothetical protein
MSYNYSTTSFTNTLGSISSRNIIMLSGPTCPTYENIESNIIMLTCSTGPTGLNSPITDSTGLTGPTDWQVGDQLRFLDYNNYNYNYNLSDPYFTHRLIYTDMTGATRSITMPKLPDPSIKSGTWISFINIGTGPFVVFRYNSIQIAIVNAFGKTSSSCKIITDGKEWYGSN